MRDMKSNIAARVAVSPEVLSGNKTGPAIDLADCNRVAFIVSTGTVVGSGSFSVKVQESDVETGGGFADVAASVIDTDALGTLEADAAYRIGYIGYKRYVRLVVTKVSGTSIALGAVAILGDLTTSPAA